MIREYIIKVDEDKKDIMGDCPLVENPKGLVRCYDCKKHGTNKCPMCKVYIFDTADYWFCADGERKDGDGDG